MTPDEIFAAELCWGCVPLDHSWIREQEVFKAMLERVKGKEFDNLNLKINTNGQNKK